MAKKVAGATARAARQVSCPKPSGKQAEPALPIDIEAVRQALYDAICETAQCPQPELARGVTANAARKATNGHSRAFRGHLARVIARQ